MRAAELGVDVVFDFGLWGKDERSALRWIAHSAGVRAEVVYLTIDDEEQRRRITGRYANQAGQFQMSDAELEQWQAAVLGTGLRRAAGRRHPRRPAGTRELVAVGVGVLAVPASSVSLPPQ